MNQAAMSDKLAVLLPSRGRRKELQRLLDSFDATHTGYADILLRNGERDETLAEYADVSHSNVIRTIGTDDGFGIWPDAGHCYAMEDLYRRFPGYAAYTIMEDDCTFPDRGWDAQVLDCFDQLPGRVGLVRWEAVGAPATILAASREWTDALGYFSPALIGEAGYHGMLELAGQRVVQGPRVHHHCAQTRWAHREPLWMKDLQDLARWKASPEFQTDRARLEVACSSTTIR